MLPPMDGELALGFALALAAACCYETGYALQALEARRAPAERALRPSLIGHLVGRPIWVGATALSLLGWPLQIAALSQAPLTLVQPTLALGLLLLLVASAGAADGLAAFVAKIVAQDATDGALVAVVLWAALVAAVVIIGLVSESTALQQFAATRVAPT